MLYLLSYADFSFKNERNTMFSDEKGAFLVSFTLYGFSIVRSRVSFLSSTESSSRALSKLVGPASMLCCIPLGRH